MKQENPLGRYTIVRELGHGGVGRVYAVRDKFTGANVALKTLDRELFEAFAERFLQQAHSAKRLSHPSIVRILDAGEADGTAYVAMELLEGESLREILDAGPLPIARAIQIASEIAGGLAYAHLSGLVHGGIKPSNIVVLHSGAVKITDFGIGQPSQAGLPSGAKDAGLSYRSPEQLRGQPFDHRSDLFSLGAVFYEMLTRSAPFEGGSPKDLLDNMLRTRPRPPSERNQHVPRALDGIVLSMLAVKPEDRMSGVPILLRELQRAEEGLGLGASDAGAEAQEPTIEIPAPTASVPPPGVFHPDPAEAFQRRAPIPYGDPFYEHDPRFMPRVREPERPSGAGAAWVAAFALMLAALSAGLTIFLFYSIGPDEIRIAATRTFKELTGTATTATAPVVPAVPAAPPQPATANANAGASTSPQAASNPVPPKPLVAEPKPAAQTGPWPADEPEEAAAADTAPPPQKAPRAALPARTPARVPRGTATLLLAVSPQGEIYIDGKHYGTTPPTTTLDLEPGMHRIEIRNRARSPYITYMTVQPGEQRRIQHDFAAQRISPPS